MKKNILYLIIVILGISKSNSQETELYKFYANQIDSSKTEYFEKKYKNGNIKEHKYLTTYYYKGDSSIFYSGQYLKISKKGIVILERFHNEYGSPLKIKTYDKNGDLYEYSKVIEIDTNAENIEEFLFAQDRVSIIMEVTKYKKNKSDVPLIVEKGIEVNNSKSGLWKIYENGIVIKTIDYKQIDKFSNLLKDKIKD